MSFRLLSLAFATALVFVAGPASAARIIVTIDGLKNLQGNQTDAQRRVKASTAPVTVMFDNLPAGTYAVGAFHDENANDHLDTNVLGLPTEGYALSNGVRPVMSKPTFQQAAFTVGSGDKPVALHIRY